MRIGIPVWGDWISPVLDTASRLLVVETQGETSPSRIETHLEIQDLQGRCVRIQGLGVDLIICGAISRPFLEVLEAAGIKVISGISGHPEEVLSAYLVGTLAQPKYLMPGVKPQGKTLRALESP